MKTSINFPSKNRSKIDAKTHFVAPPASDEPKVRPTALQERSGAVPGLLWGRPGRPKSALGAARARFWPLLGRPGAVPERARSDSDRPKQPKIDFSSILGRFVSIFGRFFFDCSSMFRRVLARSLSASDPQFASEPPATYTKSKSQKGVA